MGLGESGNGPLWCVCNMCVLVCSVLGAGTLSAGVGVGVLARKQSRSLQNLPGQGGWSWVGQSEAIPGFRGGIRVWGCTCMYLCSSVFVALEGTQPPPCFR